MKITLHTHELYPGDVELLYVDAGAPACLLLSSESELDKMNAVFLDLSDFSVRTLSCLSTDLTKWVIIR